MCFLFLRLVLILRFTQSVIYLDSGDGVVYVSQNEGKSWDAADIPKGEASMVVEHPFDNHYVRRSHFLSSYIAQLETLQAFVLTKGTKHYRTSDRGKSWQSFEVPIPPAFVSFPLSFHSDKASYGFVLYQGTKCERNRIGWGSICHDEVRWLLVGDVWRLF